MLLESNKEFVTRMYLLTQELPKNKIEDYENVLSLLSFQLKLREMNIVKEAASNLSRLVNLSSVENKAKNYLLNEIEIFKRQDRYTIQVPEDNQEDVQQVLGSTGNKEVAQTLKS